MGVSTRVAFPDHLAQLATLCCPIQHQTVAWPAHPYILSSRERLISDSKQDRRRQTRYLAPKDLLVAWQGAGRRDVSSAETVSMGGVYLFTAEPLSPGTFVEVLFDAAGGEIRARATVRHGRAGRGMGIQFVQMNSEDRARLHRFVQQLKAEQPKQSIPAPRGWFTPDALPLDSGEIETHHALFALLHRIYSTRMTGKLQLVLGRIEKQLFFNFGQLVFATSSDRNDSLGEMMLRSGALTQREFEEASALVGTGQRFGSAIAEMGIYSVEEISSWIQRQLTQITASILDYRACRFYFFNSLEKELMPEIGIAVPVGKLLLEAVRKANDLPLHHLAEDPDLWIDLSSDPLLRYQAVRLDDGERRLMSSIAQVAPAKNALAKCGLDRATAARALYALLVLGIVVSVAPSVAPQAQEAAPTRESQEPVPVSQPEPEAPSPEQQVGLKQFDEEIHSFLKLATKATHYELLSVTAASTHAQIRQSFHALARKFHPDHHMGQSELVGLLQELMARLTEAYKTLSDSEKRAVYDKQLAEKGAFALGQSKTEVEETLDDCLIRAKQCLRAHNYPGSITWLRKCVELAPDVAKYHAILARSLAAVPQYRQEAVDQFKYAIELDGWNTSTYFQFAELYEVMQLPWRAVALYQKILEIDPEHSKATERLAQLEALEKEQKKAKKSSPFSRLFQRKS
jgi:curved DNA-binding protein CbpA